MRFPWDDQPDEGPQFRPVDGGMMAPPAMPPVSEPDYFGEMQAPQELVPNDYWARVAQGAGPQPFGPMQLGPKPTGLEVLLALASGFANAKAGQGARRVSEADQRNANAREAAKTLATHRHQTRLKNMEVEARKQALAANEQYRRDALEQQKALALLRQGDLEGWRTVLADIYNRRIAAGQERAGLGGGASGTGAGGGSGAAAGGSGPSSVWARKLSTGEAKISEVPIALRTAAVEEAGTILPQKARDTIKEVNAARSILTSLQNLGDKVPRGRGIGRIGQGIKSTVEGFKQSEGLGENVANYEAMADGMLANISRASGERGVLTNQDIDRVKKNIPTVFDTKKVADNKIKNLDDLFSEFQQRAISTYTTPASGLIGEGGGATKDEVIELVRDPATGQLVRKK